VKSVRVYIVCVSWYLSEECACIYSVCELVCECHLICYWSIGDIVTVLIF